MFETLNNLDRRWIFLLMAVAVAVPILMQWSFPETPSQQARNVFDEINKLPPGSRVLMTWDFDPSTEGELEPMATAFTLHCCKRGLKMYFLTLLPAGPQMIERSMNRIIRMDFPELVYGEDYVNLGFKSGNEGVVKVIVTDLRGLFLTDARGTNIDLIPMCRDVENIQEMDLIINVSGAYPGTKEWVQYAVTPYPEIKLVAGCTGVQAPGFYPYIPDQIRGLLGAIKGAAEYEDLVVKEFLDDDPDEKYLEAKRRMGPQLTAHLLMVGLILVGNWVYYMQRKQRLA
jgi:hypothetical protein